MYGINIPKEDNLYIDTCRKCTKEHYSKLDMLKKRCEQKNKTAREQERQRLIKLVKKDDRREFLEDDC